MPVYEYACTACGERTEARQGFDDPPLDTCSFCSGKLRKLYSPVGVLFRGSGFYSTDARSNASPAKKQGDKAEGAAPAKQSGKAAKPSDGKGKSGPAADAS